MPVPTCSNKAFRHVETLFIQCNDFIRPGPLLVGGIAPANSGLGRIKTLPWMNQVSTCRKALLGTGTDASHSS